MSIIKSIAIETQITPDFMVYTETPNKFTDFFMRILKPKITVKSALGESVLTPYGEPDATEKYVLLGVIIAIGAALWL